LSTPAPAEKPAAPKLANGPACQSCGKPTEHIAQYDRYYCRDCKKYAPKGSPAGGTATASAPTATTGSGASPSTSSSYPPPAGMGQPAPAEEKKGGLGLFKKK
jgi:hypothetical protein